MTLTVEGPFEAETNNEVTRNDASNDSCGKSLKKWFFVSTPACVKPTLIEPEPVFLTVRNEVTYGKSNRVVEPTFDDVTHGMAETWYSMAAFGPGGGLLNINN